MANTTIQLKYSAVTNVPPSLLSGEPAYSNTSQILFMGDGFNVFPIGGKFFTDIINAATPNISSNTLIRRDAAGNFSANTFTANSIIGAIDGGTY